MKKRWVARRAVLAGLAGLAALVTAPVWTAPTSRSVGAATAQGTIVGEGGDAVGPVIQKLLRDDGSGLNPDSGSYTGTVDLEHGITDFIGSAPGTFGTDFAVTERALTSAEAATAAANGRTFAYVPFAATPVALVTQVPNSTYNGAATINQGNFCQNIPLNLDQLAGIFGGAGAVSPPFADWGDSRLTCPNSGPAFASKIALWANLDPTMENEALMSLLDSTPTSKAEFGAGLAAAQKGGQASTSDPTASEHWPYVATAQPGGDEQLLGKLLSIDTRSGAPSSFAASRILGSITPVANDWTGAPLGVQWNLPTAAVQNAALAYVTPSAAAAKAAEADIDLATTTDPTTNNLVTSFKASTDPAAYNNWLMMESYLLVPTKGLPADKALALAQFIRFAVGGVGQADITALGAAPATSAMITADLAVAQQLNAEASAASSTTSTSSTTTTTTTAGTTTTTSAASASSTGTSPNATTTGDSSSNGLAVTGDDPLPLLGLGLALVLCGEVARRLLRRRRAST